MFNSKRVYTIILAAGISERFGADKPKQFIKISGKTILEHTIQIFENHNLVDEIFVVTHPNYRSLVEEILVRNSYNKVTKLLNGGKTRQESSAIGVSAVPDNSSFILIHDSVRPFVSHETITRVIEKLEDYEAVDVAVPSPDTIIKVRDNLIEEIPYREELMLGQTPQGFRASVIKQAYEIYSKNPVKVTDDCGLIVKYNLGNVFVVEGSRFNIKITYPEDIYYADRIFQLKSESFTYSEEVLSSRLNNKVIVIFGASRGIGKAISELAESYGAAVYGFSRKTGCDISKEFDVKEALENVYKIEKRIDYVVNTAAQMRLGTLDSRDYNSILSEIMTNYYGSIVIAKESFRYLSETGGSLLLFSSSSYTRGRALYSIYSSTKASIVNFAQALAEEWAPYGCKVNVLTPERTNTEMRRENFGYEDPKTLLEPTTVAKVALMVLVSNFTGQVIDVKKEALDT